LNGAAPAAALSGVDTVARLRWSLLFGNFVIGCGVMVVAGSLNDVIASLEVSVALGGQLIAVAAVAMAVGAPVLAAALGRIDRRLLLTLALVWYAVGHAACALAPSMAVLTPVRALAVLAAAVFTPQAAAAVGWLAPPAQRAGAITFVFLGWSVASVLGMPLHSFIGETFGWRWAFGLVALLAAGGALWVWRVVPDGVRPPPLNLAAWKDVVTHPALMAVVMVTALSGAGQFTLFSYIAPYYRQVLGASALEISLLFGWFGLFGLLGNVLLTRLIDRVGPARAVAALIVCMGITMAVWPLAGSVALMAVALVPWALGCFASNSAQQARLGLAAPVLAPALMALNTSAIYAGQAIGAASGGALMSATLLAAGPDAPAARAFTALPVLGLVFLAAALALSVWAAGRMERAR
jgi:predicted MFS family arabinose efflux permease